MSKMERDSKARTNVKLVPVSGRTNDNFVGIKSKGNDVYLYYPECFRLDGDLKGNRKAIIALIKSIQISKSDLGDDSGRYSERENDSSFALDSYLWIIKDYLQHGIYYNREKAFHNGYDGKINWKKTMQTTPTISGKNVVYLDTIAESKREKDNLIVEIHKACIKKSIDSIGWLFGLSSNRIRTPKMTNQRKQAWLNALRSELDQSFDDDKKELLSRMIDVIRGLDSDAQSSELNYGIDNYYYVFERMVDIVFGGADNISDFYPKGKWELVKYPGKTFESSNLRPDTVLINKVSKTAYILDSKFYRFASNDGLRVDNLPESTSIQKQITYAEYIMNHHEKFGVDKVYNAFILPYDKTKEPYKSNDDLQYIGKAYTDWKKGNESHETIYAFLIDLHHLVLSWYLHQKTDDSKELVEKINQLIAE